MFALQLGLVAEEDEDNVRMQKELDILTTRNSLRKQLEDANKEAKNFEGRGGFFS